MPLTLATKYKSYPEGARSSVDAVERRFKWPIEEWPKDPHNKHLGVSVCVGTRIPGSRACSRRSSRDSSEEALVFAAQVRVCVEGPEGAP